MSKSQTPDEFKRIYQRTTCQKCNKSISQKRLKNCEERRFWPVCEDCEKKIIPYWKKAQEALAKGQAAWMK